MFLPFFESLRAARVPVSLREFLTFLEAVKAGLVTYDAEGFYYLARSSFVKDEKHLDKFDRIFGKVFDVGEAGISGVTVQLTGDCPDCQPTG